MDKNTVTLDLEAYNKLRDFKTEIENGKTLEVTHFPGPYGFTDVKFYTENEIISKFNERCKELQVENTELRNNIKELKENIKQVEVIKPKEISINDVKKMTYWEFRKWRKSDEKNN